MNMKKPLTVKVKQKRVIIPRVSRPKSFDLSPVISSVEKERQVAALQSLLINEGWMFIEQTLAAQVAVIDGQIVGKADLGGNPLEDKECDRLRDLRNAMEMVRNKPRAILDDLTRTDEQEPNDDPYA